MIRSWRRSVPVYEVPIFTRTFLALCCLGALAAALGLYREIVGLGPVSGMNDAYAWGIWKTFNVMALTGLGSGSFAIGLAVWVFGQHKLHAVMRTAIISSFLTYASGLTLLGLDVGRPWNFYSILMPWRWNAHSPMLEIAFCMPFYTAIPLLLEALPTVFEGVREYFPTLAPLCKLTEKLIRRAYPFILGLAFLLPAMHQSSLGALMLLAGEKVNPLWQTPLLPLLYVVAAAFMGFAFVQFLLLVAHLSWRRSLDLELLAIMGRLTTWIVGVWMGLRALDLVVRGVLPLAFAPTWPALLFWMETILLAGGAGLMAVAAKQRNPRLAFIACTILCVGGLLYRFDPTTLVFMPGTQAYYFPSLLELTMAAGFASLAIAAYCLAVKLLAILPAPLEAWYAMERARTRFSKRTAAFGYAAGGVAAD